MTLEDCAKNVPKRVSKIENFLRKKLHPSELVGLRYYETCVIEWKGALLVRYIILTKDSLLVTENPPKNVLLKLSLCHIEDISLVADRESLIRGSQGGREFLCRHIRIFHEVDRKDDNSNDYDTGTGSGSSTSSHEDTDSRFSSVAEMCLVEGRRGRDRIVLCRGIMPVFLRMAYDPFQDLDSPTSSEYSPPVLSGSNRIRRKGRGEDGHTSEDDSSCSSSDKHDFEVKSICSSISLENFEEMSDRRGRKHPLEKERAASMMENKGRRSWSNSDDNEDNERPQSIDISQLSTLRKKLLPGYFSRRKEGEVKIDEKADLVERRKETRGNSPTEFLLKELNLYLYQQPSTFLNELYLSWNKSKLSCVEIDDPIRIGPPDENEDLHGAENFLRLIEQEKIFTDSKYHKKFLILLPVLTSLYTSLSRQFYMRRLCWNRPKLIQNLVDILQECVDTERKGYDCETGDKFVGRVGAYGVVMDTFRLLYESCTSSFLTNPGGKSLVSQSQKNNSWTTSQLIIAIFSFPFFPKGFINRQRVLDVVCNPLQFCKRDWSNSDISEVIKVVTVAHNASTALLYEILSLIHFSPCENEKKKFFSLFKNFSLEPYLKLSVTQIINLLCPSRRPLKFMECSLLYRHVYVLKTLTDHFPSLKTFVQISFCEEFQYFIRWNCIDEKVSDMHPLKAKLMLLFQDLRKGIISSSS